MNLKHLLGNVFRDTIDSVCIFKGHRREIRKFKSPKRKAIYNTVTLSREQALAVDRLFEENYGKKVPHTWHRHFTAFTGNFDVNYFPELLYIPEFERYMNLKKEYVKVLSDKNVLPYLALAAEVAMPETLFSCASGLICGSKKGEILSRGQLVEALSNLGEAFIKPSVDSDSGRGCAVVHFSNGVDTVSGLDVESLIKNYGNNWVIQERVVCHECISRLYPNSVNTFRIITYRWRDEICHMPAIMRIGQGGKNIDNAHAGGVFIAVDDDGRLHEKAFTEFKSEYTEHPDTGIKFKDYLIPQFPLVIEAAKKCHAFIPQLGVVNWDFTIDRSGQPVLIEANTAGGSIWLLQMAHGCGAFGDKTPEVLRWLKLMRKTTRKEKATYAFGNFPDN